MEINFDHEINDKLCLKVARELLGATPDALTEVGLMILVVRDRQYCETSEGSCIRYWCRPFSLTRNTISTSEKLIVYYEDEVCKIPDSLAITAQDLADTAPPKPGEA